MKSRQNAFILFFFVPTRATPWPNFHVVVHHLLLVSNSSSSFYSSACFVSRKFQSVLKTTLLKNFSRLNFNASNNESPFFLSCKLLVIWILQWLSHEIDGIIFENVNSPLNLEICLKTQMFKKVLKFWGKKSFAKIQMHSCTFILIFTIFWHKLSLFRFLGLYETNCM